MGIRIVGMDDFYWALKMTKPSVQRAILDEYVEWAKKNEVG